MLSLETFFLWNRITSASQEKDTIVFETSQFMPENEIPPQYLIKRLRSFGDRDLNEFALKVEQLLTLNQEYTPDITCHFADRK